MENKNSWAIEPDKNKHEYLILVMEKRRQPFVLLVGH